MPPFKVKHVTTGEEFECTWERDEFNEFIPSGVVTLCDAHGFMRMCRKSMLTPVEPVEEWEDINAYKCLPRTWANSGYCLRKSERLYWNGTRVVLQRRKE